MRQHFAPRREHSRRASHDHNKNGVSRSKGPQGPMDAWPIRSNQEGLRCDHDDPTRHHCTMNMQKCGKVRHVEERVKIIGSGKTDKYEKCG